MCWPAYWWPDFFFSFFFFARVSTRTHVHAYAYTHTYTVWLRMSSGPVIDQCQTSLLLRRKRERKVDSWATCAAGCSQDLTGCRQDAASGPQSRGARTTQFCSRKVELQSFPYWLKEAYLNAECNFSPQTLSIVDLTASANVGLCLLSSLPIGIYLCWHDGVRSSSRRCW